MLGFFVPNFAVNMNPCNAIKKNWENVIKFPIPGSSLKLKIGYNNYTVGIQEIPQITDSIAYLTKSSKKTTLLIHPKNVDPIATGTFILKTNQVYLIFCDFKS
jgi:hypothetical protein